MATNPSPKASLKTVPDDSKITTLVIILYIATPCLLFLILLPIALYFLLRHCRKKRKAREQQEMEAQERRIAYEILGVSARSPRLPPASGPERKGAT